MFVSVEELIQAFADVEIECKKEDEHTFYCAYTKHPGEELECQEDYAERVMRYIAENKEGD